MSEIYRFIPLTEVHQILNESKLKFAQIALMDDKNEGLGYTFSAQESFRMACDLAKPNSFIDHHNNIKHSVYISSWTSEPDMMSMWLLYSKNCDSIRIKTSLEKLKETVADFGDRNRWDKHLDSPKDTMQILLPPEVKPVKYVSFKEISKNLNTKHKEFIKEFYKSISKDISDEEKLLAKTRMEEIEEQKIVNNGEASFLKDKCFAHEKEIRANVKVFLRNDVPREALHYPKNKHRFDFCFGGAFSYIPEAHVLPKVIHLPITSDFIESVCFDPRAPSFIRKEQEIIIKRLCPNIIIEQSDAFGYLPDSVDTTLNEDQSQK